VGRRAGKEGVGLFPVFNPAPDSLQQIIHVIFYLFLGKSQNRDSQSGRKHLVKTE
jgi:hypothetical protein